MKLSREAGEGCEGHNSGPPIYPSPTSRPSRETFGLPLTWAASPDTVDGYYVYRGANLETALQNGPLNSSLITSTSYTDQNVPVGAYVYAVRASKLTQTGTGSFHNLSQSVIVQVEVGQ